MSAQSHQMFYHLRYKIEDGQLLRTLHILIMRLRLYFYRLLVFSSAFIILWIWSTPSISDPLSFLLTKFGDMFGENMEDPLLSLFWFEFGVIFSVIVLYLCTSLQSSFLIELDAVSPNVEDLISNLFWFEFDIDVIVPTLPSLFSCLYFYPHLLNLPWNTKWCSWRVILSFSMDSIILFSSLIYA